MQRRTLLKSGLAGTALLTVAGGTAVLLHDQAVKAGKLSAPARELFLAVARGVLDGTLPAAPPARETALQAQLYRLETTLAGLPEPTQDELSQLLALLLTSPGRILFAELKTDWTSATVEEVHLSLESMRRSRFALRQQAYHALRDLTNAAFYADPVAWPLMGYPGPLNVGNAAAQNSVT